MVPGRLFRIGAAIRGLGLAVCLLGKIAAASAQICAGDCNGDGKVRIHELIIAAGIALGARPAGDCAAADQNGDGRVTIEELIAAVRAALTGCPPTPTATASASTTPSNTGTPTASATSTATREPTTTPTRTPTHTPTLVPTSTPAAAALVVRAHNDWAVQAVLEFSGERLSGPPPRNDEISAYGPLSASISSTDAAPADLVIPAHLAPGVWVHHARAPGSPVGYAQHQQSLVIADAEAPNVVEWSLFRTVLTVNRGDDGGDGVCDETCTLRDAIDTATTAPPPVLIVFDTGRMADDRGRVHVRIDHDAPLLVRAPGTEIDGRDAAGNPSSLADFADRTYPTTITLIAENTNPDPSQPCPCTESNGGAIRVQADRVHLEGLAIVRQLAAEGTICCGDQDLVAFDAGSRDSGISTSLLDGGAQAISSAQVAQGETQGPTGKDCVEARSTGATADHPIVVENSELRYCHDRGVKSKAGFVQLERNWIHHNLRGGVFVLSPTGGMTDEGVVAAVANLIEQDGRNCPTGDPSDCGPGALITRTQASEMSAQGNLTGLITAGNVLRGGVLQGMYFQGRSEGVIANDYVCGIDNAAGGGVGILVKLITPSPPVTCITEDDCEDDGVCVDGQCVDDTAGAPTVSVRGVTTAYNTDSGVRLNGYRSADFGTGGSVNAGRNAFAANGFDANGVPRLKRNFVNALVDTTALVPAQGNQWEHCYPASGADLDTCNAQSISRNDTNNTNSATQADRVDAGNPQPHASTGPLSIDSVAPLRVLEGGIVHIDGRGFDAISGHSHDSPDCAGLKSGNGCDPLHGTCVEFLADGRWVAAADVLGMTPTHLVVRSPITCVAPTLLRVRRATLNGDDIASQPVPFCRN
jgi:hypothetical protein